jgi:DNA-binding LacI/PurR family transcriptional regulator
MKNAASSSRKAQAIHAELRREIMEGRWKIGDRLPTETELATRFDCSPGTVNKAAGLLVHEGLVARNPRAGMRVVGNSTPVVEDSLQFDAYAFIFPSALHEGIQRTVQGFMEAAVPLGRRVITLTTDVDYEKETQLISRLSDFGVKGAVIIPLIPTPQQQYEFYQAIRSLTFPNVLCGVKLPGLGSSCVLLDNFQAGYETTKHLLDQGLRDIGFFSNYSWSDIMRDRFYGYRWALKEAGVAGNADHVFLHEGRRLDFIEPLRESTELAREYLGRAAGVEGIVCADDFLAHGMIAAAREAGIQVPAKLKVTGIDDNRSLARASNVELTTYHVSYEQIGRTAFEQLEIRLKDPQAKPVEVLVAGELRIRASTA